MEVWPPELKREQVEVAMPGWRATLGRGLAMRCPACGAAPAFDGFVTVRRKCANCDAPLGRVRLELLPTALTISVGLVVMGSIMFLVQNAVHLELFLFILIFVPACAAFELLLVRPVRGLVLGIMLKLNVLHAPDEWPQGG